MESSEHCVFSYESGPSPHVSLRGVQGAGKTGLCSQKAHVCLPREPGGVKKDVPGVAWRAPAHLALAGTLPH